MDTFFQKNFGWILSVAGLLFGAGVAKSKLATKVEVNKKLFKDNGSLIYETVEACEKSKAACIKGVTEKLDGINNTLILDQKKDEARDETMTDIRLFLAKLEGERTKKD